MRILFNFKSWAVLILILSLSGCMHYTRIGPQAKPLVAAPGGGADMLIKRFAPAFLIHNPHQEHNLIGRPQAIKGTGGKDDTIYVNPDHPVIYYETHGFETPNGKYTNLIYRVHFPGTPLSLIPFIIGNGDNNGNLVVITLNQQNQPVLIATVGTCGCYISLSSTSYTPASALPKDQEGDQLEIYGETLPARLDLTASGDQRLLVSIGPGEHRIVDLAVLEAKSLQPPSNYTLVQAELRPVSDLDRLPLKGAPGETTSLFVENGLFVGHVKGAWKPWETLLLGLWSMDIVVGMDKAYGNPENPFYTSLPPWYRIESDMNDYPRFLKFWGWNL
jgi:hypothetical protein